MQNTIYSLILQQIISTDDVEAVLSASDRILQDIYHTSHESIQKELSHLLRPEIEKAILTTLSTQQIVLTNTEALKKFFLTLRSLLTAVTVISLTLAFSPTDEVRLAIGRKAKELFGETTILEITVQEAVVGGAVIVFQGKYLDYSLRHAIDMTFTTHTKEIHDILTPKTTPS